jgi:hypothetical protein
MPTVDVTLTLPSALSDNGVSTSTQPAVSGCSDGRRVYTQMLSGGTLDIPCTIMEEPSDVSGSSSGSALSSMLSSSEGGTGEVCATSSVASGATVSSHVASDWAAAAQPTDDDQVIQLARPCISDDFLEGDLRFGDECGDVLERSDTEQYFLSDEVANSSDATQPPHTGQQKMGRVGRIFTQQSTERRRRCSTHHVGQSVMNSSERPAKAKCSGRWKPWGARGDARNGRSLGVYTNALYNIDSGPQEHRVAKSSASSELHSTESPSIGAVP